MKLFDEGDVPDEESARRFVKEFCAGYVTQTDSGYKNNNHLHIPDPFNDDQPLCSSGMDKDWERKDLAVYPMGSKPFCRRCLARAFPDKAAINVKVKR